MASGTNEKAVDQKTLNTYPKKEEIYLPNSPSPNWKTGSNSKISFFHSETHNQKTELRSTLRRPEIVNHFHSSILNTVALNVGGNIFVTTKQTLSREKSSILRDIEKQGFLRDSKNRIFLDRDGDLFEHILKYLETGALYLPVLLFHRIASITVSGHVQSCKIVFGDYLCMDRDSNIEQDRYSCRMMLRNLSLSSASEVLQRRNFTLKTSETIGAQGHVNVNKKVTEQEKWVHTTLYVFMKNLP